jgi:hypothetical protein
VKTISTLVEQSLNEAGFVVVKFDGHVLLIVEDADEYEVRVQRQDDPALHYMPIRAKVPLDVEGIWRIVKRAERWLRPERRRTLVT